MTKVKFIAAMAIIWAAPVSAAAQDSHKPAAEVKPYEITALTTAPANEAQTRRTIKKVVKPVPIRLHLESGNYRNTCDHSAPSVSSSAVQFKSKMKIVSSPNNNAAMKFAKIEKVCSQSRHIQKG